jgi:hypothetical protein
MILFLTLGFSLKIIGGVGRIGLGLIELSDLWPYSQNFFHQKLMNGSKELRVLVRGRPLQPNVIFAGEASSLP